MEMRIMDKHYLTLPDRPKGGTRQPHGVVRRAECNCLEVQVLGLG